MRKISELKKDDIPGTIFLDDKDDSVLWILFDWLAKGEKAIFSRYIEIK